MVTMEGGAKPAVGSRRPSSNTSFPHPPKRRRGRLSSGVNFRSGRQKAKPRMDYIRMPESYDQDSSDNYTKPFAVRKFLGGYGDKFDSMGDGFIYGRSTRDPFEECPKVSCTVVDKAISPIELEMEFGKEEKKTLPSYYYSGGKPPKNNKKSKERKVSEEGSLDEPLTPNTPKKELKTPTFIGESPWCFASPDKNFQIFVLPPKPNILKFDTQPETGYGGYGNSFGRSFSKPYQYTRDNTEINREMSGLSLSSAKTETITATMPGVIHDMPTKSRNNNTRAGSGRSMRRQVDTPTSRLPGRAQYN